MKKEYIKPELEETLVLVESAILGGSITDDPADPNEPAGGRGRRGSWGSLWDEED